MPNALVINAHHPYEFAKGRLNATLADLAADHLSSSGYEVRRTATAEDYDTNTEVDHHVWADLVFLQTPVNWMGTPWSFKRYIDDVYTAGMDGRLCNNDGRTRENPKANYGAGGSLAGTKYMMSLTFNAPRESFDDPSEYLFQGRSVDDLFLPMHMNFRFFAMEALPTFACFDVMKNPEIESDLARFSAHLAAHVPVSKAD